MSFISVKASTDAAVFAPILSDSAIITIEFNRFVDVAGYYNYSYYPAIAHSASAACQVLKQQ
jgi:hypothetical protein